jgi:dTDP-4-dehydrorhamnose 3,5-epimerase
MTAQKTDFKDLFVIEPKVFEDPRGYFFESYNHKAFFETTGLNTNWVQDNQSLSNKGVFRGFHFQKPPYAQDKLVRVTQGSVLDIVVDLRSDEPTFGKHFSLELSAKNKKQLFLPKGFAHAFLVLEDETIFQYKCSELYSKESDAVLSYNDPTLALSLPTEIELLLSEKDKNGKTINEFKNVFQRKQ